MTLAAAPGFRRSRRLVLAGLIMAVALIIAYWVLWWSDRPLVASRTTPDYYRFEDGFALADGWLLSTVMAATLQLWRQRPSALLWLIAAGSVGLYLLGMDTLYDLQQGIYASNTAGVLEFVIDLLLATASLSALWWSWHNRRLLLNPPSGREPTADHLAPSTPGPQR